MGYAKVFLMKNLFVLLTVFMVFGCSEQELTDKYETLEECAFEEAKKCKDQTCSVSAYRYCKSEFSKLPELKEWDIDPDYKKDDS